MNTQTGTCKLRLQVTMFAQFVLLCARCSNVSHFDDVFFHLRWRWSLLAYTWPVGWCRTSVCCHSRLCQCPVLWWLKCSWNLRLGEDMDWRVGLELPPPDPHSEVILQWRNLQAKEKSTEIPKDDMWKVPLRKLYFSRLSCLRKSHVIL